MSIISRTIAIIVILFTGVVSHAQYFQYSQYNFTRQRVNPAMIGLSNNAVLGFDYRNQKTGGDSQINSNFFSFEYPLLNSSTGRPWSGLGLTLHNDKASGIFKTQEAAISYAIHIRVSRWQTLSLGVKALLQTRAINMDGFYTGSQYVPDRGFDPAYSSGENFEEQKATYETFSTGLYWQETDRKGRLLHHFGFSFFDLNRPQDSFFGDPSQLSSTFVFNGGFQLYSTKDFHIFPEALFTYSASNAVLNAGLRFQKEINIRPMHMSDRVEVITKYVVGRSGILGVQLHTESISLGLSYDFPVLNYNVGNTGALEVGFEWRKPVKTRAQKISAKRKKEAEEKKKQQAKNTQPTSPKTTTAAAPIKETKQDSVMAIPSVTVDTLAKASDAIATSAKAGVLKQEPLVIEKVTLHFPFEFNSSELDEHTEKFLKDLTLSLQEDENLKVKIEGHTDNIGSDKFNLRLSQKRADAVKHYLIKSGISPERLQSEGMGMHQPLNENLTDAARAKNRRVELTIYY
jgi:type IX secretion system PorP/SprF family membrane protein